MLAQLRVTSERAVEHIDGEERAGTVADDYGLVGVAAAHRIHHCAGEGFHALLPVRPLAVRELLGRDDVIAEIEQVSLRFGKPEQGGKGTEPGNRADNVRYQRGRAERGDEFQ